MVHVTIPGRDCHREKDSPGMRPSGPAEVILESLDIVLAEILPLLHLGHDDRLFPGVLDPVDRPERDVDRPARGHPDLPSVECDQRLSPDEIPMLRPVPMPLQAEPLPRPDGELLDLESFRFEEDQVIPPGSFPFFAGPALRKLVEGHRFSISRIPASSFFTFFRTVRDPGRSEEHTSELQSPD